MCMVFMMFKVFIAFIMVLIPLILIMAVEAVISVTMNVVAPVKLPTIFHQSFSWIYQKYITRTTSFTKYLWNPISCFQEAHLLSRWEKLLIEQRERRIVTQKTVHISFLQMYWNCQQCWQHLIKLYRHETCFQISTYPSVRKKYLLRIFVQIDVPRRVSHWINFQKKFSWWLHRYMPISLIDHYNKHYKKETQDWKSILRLFMQNSHHHKYWRIKFDRCPMLQK